MFLAQPDHALTARSSTLVKLEALRSCVHACDLGTAFLSWASALSRPPKTAVESQQQKRHTSSQSRWTTLRLLEALRLVVLHEPLGHAHHALQRWHELAKVGRSPYFSDLASQPPPNVPLRWKEVGCQCVLVARKPEV